MSADTAPPTETPAPTGRSRRRLVIIVAGLLSLVVGAAGYLLLGDGAADPDGDAPVAAEPAEGPIVEVGVLTTNLAGSPARYARVGVALVLQADADPEAVSARFALVKDAVISEIGRHDASSLQAGDGAEVLRDDLTRRMQLVFPDGEVVRVVLTELLVQ